MIPFIGGHVSVAGGLVHGIENATKIGAECIQIFGASPRQWAAAMHSQENIDTYLARKKQSNVREVYLHASYLVNLASPLQESREKSMISLVNHLRICDAIQADGLIFHVGSGKEMDKQEALTIVIKELKQVLQEVSGTSRLIIENSAGGGAKIASSAQEIGKIMKGVGSQRLKVCIDTAHAFEAGMIEQYTPENIRNYFDEFEQEVGCEHIVALHVNDSKSPFNSHYDRHENIGEGYIGLKGFQALAKEKRILNTAWLLEVPGFDNLGPDKKNIDILKNLFNY